MLYFWLFASVVIFIGVTYMGFTEGFSKWAFYYLFAGLAILMYIVRKWMIKRMKKHMAFLEEQRKKEAKASAVKD